MKQRCKKTLLLILSMVLALGLTMLVQAAQEPLEATTTAAGILKVDGNKKVTTGAKVTITNSITDVEGNPEITFKAYQIVYAEYDSVSNSLEYKLTSWAATALGSTATADNVIKSVNSGTGTTEQNNVLNTIAAAKGDANKTEQNTTIYEWTANAKDPSITTAKLPLGVYLVTADATGMSFLNMMVSVDTSATTGTESNAWLLKSNGVTLKGEPITINKEIVKDDKNEKADAVQIGDTVSYKITVDVPHFPDNANPTIFKVVDTPQNLKIQLQTVEVKADGNPLNEENGDYKAEVDKSGKLTVDFSTSYKAKNIGNYNTVTITYKATVLSTAVTGSDENKNTATLKYNHDPYSENTYDVPTGNDPKVYTYGFKLTKYGENTAKTLANAGFKVKDAAPNGSYLSFVKQTDGSYKVYDGSSTEEVVTEIFTQENGTVILKGLGEKTYTLEETTAPSGYSRNTNTLDITIKAKNDETTGLPTAEATVTSTEKNSKDDPVTTGNSWTISGNNTTDGTETSNGLITLSLKDTKLPSLPATGGVGIVLFTIVGVIMMILAVILFFEAKKKKQPNAK